MTNETLLKVIGNLTSTAIIGLIFYLALDKGLDIVATMISQLYPSIVEATAALKQIGEALETISETYTGN